MSYRKVKNLILFVIVCFALFFISPQSPSARVKGKCKDCHSMHAGEPSPVLAKGGCIGCHGQKPEGDQNIIVIGKARIPQVLHHMPDGDLAGGNFYNVADGYMPIYGNGHNVAGISSHEPSYRSRPPGFIGSVVIPGGIGPSKWPYTKQLTCAGTWGCHGNRNIEDPFKSMAGAHHEDDAVIDGTTVGKSYRFLYGIVGREHKDWNYNATVEDHNGYKGDPQHVEMNTISYLCGECHSFFHPNRNLGGAYSKVWDQHLSDADFSNVIGGYEGSEFQAFNVYNPDLPMAYKNPTGKEQVVDINSILMCLTCHKAHATTYNRIMRFDYKSVIAQGYKSGCSICHTGKGK